MIEIRAGFKTFARSFPFQSKCDSAGQMDIYDMSLWLKSTVE